MPAPGPQPAVHDLTLARRVVTKAVHLPVAAGFKNKAHRPGRDCGPGPDWMRLGGAQRQSQGPAPHPDEHALGEVYLEVRPPQPVRPAAFTPARVARLLSMGQVAHGQVAGQAPGPHAHERQQNQQMGRAVRAPLHPGQAGGSPGCQRIGNVHDAVVAHHGAQGPDRSQQGPDRHAHQGGPLECVSQARVEHLALAHQYDPHNRDGGVEHLAPRESGRAPAQQQQPSGRQRNGGDGEHKDLWIVHQSDSSKAAAGWPFRYWGCTCQA